MIRTLETALQCYFSRPGSPKNRGPRGAGLLSPFFGPTGAWACVCLCVFFVLFSFFLGGGGRVKYVVCCVLFLFCFLSFWGREGKTFCVSFRGNPIWVAKGNCFSGSHMLIPVEGRKVPVIQFNFGLALWVAFCVSFCCRRERWMPYIVQLGKKGNPVDSHGLWLLAIFRASTGLLF